MDLNAVRAKLQKLQTKTTRQNNLWKPDPGKQVIRIVPYKFNQDYPFIELNFHYGLGGKTYLSPTSFGRPDPIEEMADKLKSTGDKENYELSKKLRSKMRVYAPVIVRGQESEGVKFWGFGKQVYTELLAIIDDPDYGDISDPTSGHDLTIEFTPSDKPGTFPSTTVRAKPAKTPATEDSVVIESIGNQQEITEIFKEASYEDLKTALENWLNGEGDSQEETTNTTADTVSNETETTKVDDAAGAFNALFND